MRNVLLNIGLIVTIAAVSACGGGDSDFNGTYTGYQTAPTQSSLTLTLTQNGESIGGQYQATATQGGQPVSGTISGTVQGSQATINVATQISGTCSGSVTQTQGQISGSLACASGGGPGNVISFQVAKQQPQ